MSEDRGLIGILDRLRKNGLRALKLHDVRKEGLRFEKFGFNDPDYCVTFIMDHSDEDVEQDLNDIVKILNTYFRGLENLGIEEDNRFGGEE